MSNQIFVAVADGSQREWTESEKQLIRNNPELLRQLMGWLTNSLSDNCWHPENYHFLRGLTKANWRSIPDLLSTEEIEIPF